MRFRFLKSNHYAINAGLHPINMEKLGQVVAIFGPNGAGKTRLLNLVYTMYAQVSAELGSKAISQSRTQSEQAIATAENRIRELNETKKKIIDPKRLKKLERDIQEGRNTTSTSSKQIQMYTESIELSQQGCLEGWDSKFTCGFINGQIAEIPEVMSYKVEEIGYAIHQLRNPVSNDRGVQKYLPPFLHDLARALSDSQNPMIDQSIIESKREVLTEFQRIIKIFLKQDFSFNYDKLHGPLPALNGRTIKIGELSRGQQVLFKFSISLLQQSLINFADDDAVSLADALLFIDEPETHLHPEALIKFIDGMREIVGPNGQIWITTHCIPLLGFLKPDEIWVVENGQVLHPSVDIVDKAMASLVGGQDNIEKLYDCIQEPFAAATNKFAAECLRTPSVVEFKPNDPQVSDLNSIVNERVNNNKDYLIVDCGAGKGRFASMLSLTLDEKTKERLKYIPVEPEVFLWPDIKSAAKTFLLDGPFENMESIPGTYHKQVDLILLCNVLHEIRPTKWISLFGECLSALKDDGAILICEDQRMPHGEMPHDLGFFIFGPHEFQKLFKMTKPVSRFISTNETYKDRLLYVMVSRKELNYDISSIKDSITCLRDRLMGSVTAMRGKPRTASLGREYSFAAQQIINCNLALKELP